MNVSADSKVLFSLPTGTRNYSNARDTLRNAFQQLTMTEMRLFSLKFLQLQVAELFALVFREMPNSVQLYWLKDNLLADKKQRS